MFEFYHNEHTRFFKLPKYFKKCLKANIGTSLVVQWLGICLPIQGTWVRSQAGKTPHDAGQLCLCITTTEPKRCNYWASALEPVLHNKRSHHEKPVHLKELAPTLSN